MYKTYFTLFCILFSLNLHAVNIDWIGGVGDWDDPAMWSTGTIPSLVDDVDLGFNNTISIPSAYLAYAKSVNVGTGTSLRIKLNALLKIETDGAVGLNNHGETIIKGRLRIKGDKAITFGIINYGTLWNKQAGITKISRVKLGVINYGEVQNAGQCTIWDAEENLSTSGIHHDNGSFTNHVTGVITLYDLERRGIYCAATNFVNYGLIDFQHNIGEYEFYNTDLFVNYGEINVSEYTGISIYNSASIENYGTFTFSGGTNTSIAIQNWLSDFANKYTGSIIITDGEGKGINLHGVGHQFINRGLIEMGQSGAYAISVVDGSFTNKPAGEINLEGTFTSAALYVEGSGMIDNEGGNIDIDITSGNNIYAALGGSVQNTACGTISLNGAIWTAASGSFENHAWLDIKSLLSAHINSGTIDNYGVVNDPTNSLDGTGATNYGIIVRPIPGVVSQNVASNNALLVGSLAGSITVATDWTKGPGGSSLGTYDAIANTFTPNGGSEGNEKAHILFTIAGCTATQGYDIDIPGGILPLRMIPESDFAHQGANLDIQDLEVYPNPVEDQIHLNFTQPMLGKVQISIMDVSGKKVWSTTTNLESKRMHLTRPNNLAAGAYFMHITDQNGRDYQAKLILI